MAINPNISKDITMKIKYPNEDRDKQLERIADGISAFVWTVRSVLIGICLGLLFSFLTSCGKQYVPMKYECRPDPAIRSIKVKNNCVCGAELRKMINNHIDIYEYVEYLKLKGCLK